MRDSNEMRNKLEMALTDSLRMKEDIVDSMEIILYKSEEKEYRPVMTNYQNNLREYKQLGNKMTNQSIEMRKLHFKDPLAACNALEEGLQIHWQGND